MVFGLVVLVLIWGCVLLQWLNFGDFIRDLLWLRTRIFVYCMLRLIVCVLLKSCRDEMVLLMLPFLLLMAS